MTKEDLEEIFSCSECTTILTDNDWSESYSVPLTMTVKELRDLHKTLPSNDSLPDSNKHELLVMPKIDELISKLQVYGFQIRINNHNIGDFHNIMISKFQHIRKEIYELVQIDCLQLRLPLEADGLLNTLQAFLEEAEKS